MRRFQVVVAFLICAVMVLIAAVPLAIAGTHEIVKSGGGPNANARTWEYVPPGLGTWSGHIVNNGLRSLVVDVYDNSTGMLEEIMHQRIRFAACGAFPTGTVDTKPVIMSPAHKYVISVIPNGPTGAQCELVDVFTPQYVPPVPVFTATVDYATVFVDATGSYDPDGSIAVYYWAFGDGSVSSGITQSHRYSAPGTYGITLEVVDNDGLKNWTSLSISIIDSPPIAHIDYVATNGLEVEASCWGSWDDFDIYSLVWDWGDGSPPQWVSGWIESHTYSAGPGGILHFTITLTVTDSIGQVDSTSREVVIAPLPVASFTYSVSGSTVYVDASMSSAEAGIISYTWDWCDGSAPEVLTIPTASHSYGLTSSLFASLSIGRTPPAFPFSVFGFVYGPDGVSPVVDASVTITNKRSGYVALTSSMDDGFYAWSSGDMPGDPSMPWDGDVLNVTVVKGQMIGWNEGIVDQAELPYLWLDVCLLEGPSHLVKLTITDTLGQSCTLTQVILTDGLPVASFTCTVNGFS